MYQVFKKIQAEMFLRGITMVLFMRMILHQGDVTSERDLLRWVKKAVENDDIEEVVL